MNRVLSKKAQRIDKPFVGGANQNSVQRTFTGDKSVSRSRIKTDRGFYQV